MAPINPPVSTVQPCRVAPRPVKDIAAEWQWASSTTSAEAIMEQLAVMRRFESTTYQAKNYCRDNTNNNSDISRCMTVEYLYQVVDYGGFQRDVVTYAMTHLMDRYLASSCHDKDTHKPDRNHNQLVALTCLYMAVKLLEPNNIGIDSLVPLTNHVYTVEHFIDMESRILACLKWRVAHGPTPLMFVQQLLLLLSQQLKQSQQRSQQSSHSKLASALYPHIQYQLELAVSNADLSLNYGPSDVGIAAIWNALEAIDVSVFSVAEKKRYQQVVQKALGMEVWDEPKLIHIQSTLRKLMVAAYTWSTTANSIASTVNCTENTPEKTALKGTVQNGASRGSSKDRTSAATVAKPTPTEEDDSSSSSEGDSENEPVLATTPNIITPTKSQSNCSGGNPTRQMQQPRQLMKKRSSRSDASINDVSEVEWFLTS